MCPFHSRHSCFFTNTCSTNEIFFSLTCHLEHFSGCSGAETSFASDEISQLSPKQNADELNDVGSRGQEAVR